MKLTCTAALLVITVAMPVAARAQGNAAITMSAGVITGRDAAPSPDFTRPIYTVSIQRVFWRYFVIDGEAARWSLVRRIEHGPHDITGPQGRLGSGAGAGWSTDRNVYSQQSVGCSPIARPAHLRAFSEHDRPRADRAPPRARRCRSAAHGTSGSGGLGSRREDSFGRSQRLAQHHGRPPLLV